MIAPWLIAREPPSERPELFKSRTDFILAAALVAAFASVASAQIGTRFPSEKKIVNDPVTGVPVTFLTSAEGKGDSKIYQTHHQWTADGKWVVFRSNMHGPTHVYAVEVAKSL